MQAHVMRTAAPLLVIAMLIGIIRGSESNAVYLAGHRDFPSNARPVGIRADQGAYEYRP